MFREAGFENQDASISYFRRWVAEKIATSEYLGLIATDDEKPGQMRSTSSLVAGRINMVVTLPCPENFR